MILRGLDFGRVLGASGVQGFFGEGYPIHKWLGPLAPNFKGMTFVAKTTTLYERAGNMPMREDGITPVELIPKCIWANPLKGIALNAVGLSGPGALALINEGRWQCRTEPFMISFMSVLPTPGERLEELRRFVDLLNVYLKDFHAAIALQINVSCPNVGVHSPELVIEVENMLAVAHKLGIPIVIKLAVTSPVETGLDIAHLPGCDGLCVSNTIPFGQIAHHINWKQLFTTYASPNVPVSPLTLRGYQPGGLSGKLLFDLVAGWLTTFRSFDTVTPVNAGGGILAPRSAIDLLDLGANSIFIGSMAFLRPWNVQRTIRAVHNRYKEKT